METYKIENLSFKYKNAKNHVLKDVSFSVSEGDFALVCGKSGCGKSTLLKILKQNLPLNGQTFKQVSFLGEDIESIDKKSIAQDIGYVMQNPDNQIVCDDVYSELCFGMSQLGFDRAEMNKRVFEVANYFGINNYLNMEIQNLSGGQKQLVAICSILCLRPKVLLLDEPCANLDPNSIQLLLDALERINKEQGLTIIIVEQNVDDIYPLCSNIIAMDMGKVIFACEKKDIAKHMFAFNYKDIFPVYVQGYCAITSKDNCPLNMKEARDWIKTIDKLSIQKESKSIYFEENAVVLKDLSFRFEKNSKDILNGICLNVKKGEFACIFGANGSGKSTLLQTICKVKKCYNGKAKLLGKWVMVGQNPLDLFCGFKVADMFSKASSLFDAFEINELMDTHPFDLSGGEIKRVILVKALMENPDILLLDEVTTGMGEHFKKVLANELLKRQKNGMTIIMASHDLEFCAMYANTAHLLFCGEIIASGNIKDMIYTNEFYTTKARILTKGIIDGITTNEDVMKLCQIQKEDC